MRCPRCALKEVNINKIYPTEKTQKNFPTALARGVWVQTRLSTPGRGFKTSLQLSQGRYSSGGLLPRTLKLIEPKAQFRSILNMQHELQNMQSKTGGIFCFSLEFQQVSIFSVSKLSCTFIFRYLKSCQDVKKNKIWWVFQLLGSPSAMSGQTPSF